MHCSVWRKCAHAPQAIFQLARHPVKMGLIHILYVVHSTVGWKDFKTKMSGNVHENSCLSSLQWKHHLTNIVDIVLVIN